MRLAQKLRDASLKHKLVAIMLTTAGAVMLILAVALAINEKVVLGESAEAQLVTLADVVSRNSVAPIVFNDRKAAMDTLSALETRSNIVCAALYDGEGHLFARYVPSTASVEFEGSDDVYAKTTRQQVVWQHDRVILARPIRMEDKQIGALVICGDSRDLSRAFWRFAVILAGVVLVAVAVAVTLAFLFQRTITRPVLGLRQAMDLVSRTRDYSVRMEKVANDELGALVDRFNAMLGEIHRRDAELAGYNSRLEQDVAVRTSELSDANGALEQTVAQLREAIEAAEAASRAKSQFLANMSHEIRTPMNGVMGMLELALKGELPGQQRRFVQTAFRSAESLLTIINDILDFSRVESGRLTLESIDIDLRALIAECCEAQARSAHARGLELTYFIAPGVDTGLTGDPVRIRQVVTNLLGNAIKFTEQGEVSITVAQEPAADGLLLTRIAVRDTGIGMDLDTQQRLFAPFVQADGSTTRRYGGTGLGLAICKQLAELMHGDIVIESAVGAGSTFTFSLAAPRCGTPVPAQRPLAGLSDRRVLIVDDNATNREILARTVGGWGMLATTAESGHRALEILRAPGTAFDVVVCDVVMPGMDGIDLLREVRREHAVGSLPAVLLTSLGPNAERTGQGPRVADELLGKPVRAEELQKCLCRVLSRRGASQERPTGPEEHEGDFVLPPAKILVAEDNPTNQMVAQSILESWGMRVTLVGDGRAAVDACRAEAFDLVFMDCMMPGTDGLQATAEIRGEEESAPQRRRTPIVALTAAAMPEEKKKCFEAGMDDYVAKPIRQAQLAAVLRRWLAAPGAGEPAAATPAETTVTTTGGGGPSDCMTREAEAGRAPDPGRVAGGPAAAVIDVAALEPLRALRRHGQPVLPRLVLNYRETSPALISELRVALSSGERDEARRLAHTIKSSSATMGARRLSALAREVELEIAAGAVEIRPAALDAIEAEYARVEAALATMLAKEGEAHVPA
jgi:two-component system, sensor histidine kinase and response regulator